MGMREKSCCCSVLEKPTNVLPRGGPQSDPPRGPSQHTASSATIATAAMELRIKWQCGQSLKIVAKVMELHAFRIVVFSSVQLETFEGNSLVDLSKALDAKFLMIFTC